MPLSTPIDLGRIAREIPGGTKPRETFKASFKAAAGAQADLLELQFASRCLLQLATLDKKAGEVSALQAEADATVGRSLYLGAVLAYTRATEEDRSKHKPKKTTLLSGFSADMLKAHKYMMTLRDDSFAHWGPGFDLAREPHFDITLYKDAEDVRSTYLISNYRGATANTLAVLIAATEAAAQARVVETIQSVKQAFEALMAAEPDLEMHPIDLKRYLVVPAAAPAAQMTITTDAAGG